MESLSLFRMMGKLLVFGDTPVSNIAILEQPESRMAGRSFTGRRIIRKTGINSGYGVVIGTENIRLLKNLVSKTSFH